MIVYQYKIKAICNTVIIGVALAFMMLWGKVFVRIIWIRLQVIALVLLLT